MLIDPLQAVTPAAGSECRLACTYKQQQDVVPRSERSYLLGNVELTSLCKPDIAEYFILMKVFFIYFPIRSFAVK